MRKDHWLKTLAGFSMVLCLVSAGCQQNSPTPDPATSAHEHGHDHPSEGPHGGSLIELGNEEYHAEITHDHDNGQVTIYLLDGAAKNSLGIDAMELVVNVKEGAQGKQFKLASAPMETDPEGTTSRFVSTEPEFSRLLDDKHQEATLVVTINGKQYRGEIEHSHADHDHEHQD